MVSFTQVQCLNCGTIDDVISMGGEGEASWCSQCGFTRRTAQHMSQERMLQQQLLAEDEQLAALLSKNMWLSENQQSQAQRPSSSAAHAAIVANPAANISISQHYHHYCPTAPPAPVSAPTQAASPFPPPTYSQNFPTSSSNPETALQDYHRSLNLVEEEYHHRVQQQQYQQHQQNQQYPPSPTGSTVSSIQDDRQLQMFLLEQHNLAQEAEKLRLYRAREEEQMICNQLMADSREDVMSDDDSISWAGGQPMPNLVQHEQHLPEMEQKVVYPVNSGQPWVAGGEEPDIYGMDDEESPCVTYYSRVCYADYL